MIRLLLILSFYIITALSKLLFGQEAVNAELTITGTIINDTKEPVAFTLSTSCLETTVS